MNAVYVLMLTITLVGGTPLAEPQPPIERRQEFSSLERCEQAKTMFLKQMTKDSSMSVDASCRRTK